MQNNTEKEKIEQEYLLSQLIFSKTAKHISESFTSYFLQFTDLGHIPTSSLLMQKDNIGYRMQIVGIHPGFIWEDGDFIT